MFSEPINYSFYESVKWIPYVVALFLQCMYNAFGDLNISYAMYTKWKNKKIRLCRSKHSSNNLGCCKIGDLGQSQNQGIATHQWAKWTLPIVIPMPSFITDHQGRCPPCWTAVSLRPRICGGARWRHSPRVGQRSGVHRSLHQRERRWSPWQHPIHG